MGAAIGRAAATGDHHMTRMLVSAVLLAAAPVMPAWALGASSTIEIAAPPAKVWATIGGFCGIGDWHPAVAACTLSTVGGKPVRTIALKGGGTIVERQEQRDDKAMSYTYSIVSGPLPVSDYSSTLAVAKHGAGSIVTWSGSFKAKGATDAEARAAIDGIYASGVKAIAAKVR